MSRSLEVRNHLAEMGCEFTPNEAEEIVQSLDNIRERVREMMSDNPDHFFRLAEQTPEEKIADLRRLANEGLVLSPKEYNQNMNVLLTVWEQEREED